MRKFLLCEMFCLFFMAVSFDVGGKEIATGDVYNNDLMFRDMTVLAEAQLNTVNVTPYQTVAGAIGKMVELTNPMAMGLVLQWSHAGHYAVTAGVAADTDKLKVKFGYDSPVICRERKTAHNVSVKNDNEICLNEIYLGSFKNDGGDIRIRIELPKGGKVAYLKFSPFSQPAWPKTNIKGNSRVLIDNDGHSVFYMNMFTNQADMANYTGKYRNTDIQGVVWCVGDTVEVNYKSRIAPLCFGGVTDFQRPPDKRIHDIVRYYIATGKDTLDAAIEVCRNNGLSCLVSLRMNKSVNPTYDYGRSFPLYEKFRSMFVYKQDGTRGTYLSYGFKKIRDHALSLIAEVAERDPDGIILDFTRCPPYVGFHPDLVNKFTEKFNKFKPEFRETYNIDKNKPIDPDDPRWLKIKSEPLTELMRKVRKIVDKKREENPGFLSVVHVFHKRLLRESGIDINTWIDEGLIDVLIIGSSLAYSKLVPWSMPEFAYRAKKNGITVYCQLDSHYNGHDPTPAEERARARGEKVVVEARNVTEEYYRKTAYKFYAEGADGVLIWDGFFNLGVVPELGNRDKLYEWNCYELAARQHKEVVNIIKSKKNK